MVRYDASIENTVFILSQCFLTVSFDTGKKTTWQANAVISIADKMMRRKRFEE